MYIKRMIEQKIKDYNNQFSVIVLTGARQVGKSTLLQMIKDQDMKIVTLDDFSDRELANKDPKYFLEFNKSPLLIDEIQYAPNLLSDIKINVDKNKFNKLNDKDQISSMYWLTGSQQFNVMKDISESLAGRIKEIDLIYEEGDNIYPIEIKKNVLPNHPDKNLSFLNKFNKNIQPLIVICMAEKLQAINRNCILCPIELI